MAKLQNKLPRQVWRLGVGVVGGIVLLAGIIMIPYPGPGWAVVFVGLAILAQEFTWAQRTLRYARAMYSTWELWVKQRSAIVRIGLFILTAVVVVITIWLLNGYGLINSWLHLGWGWLNSPFVQ